jgi:hypothetical protein
MQFIETGTKKEALTRAIATVSYALTFSVPYKASEKARVS